MLSGVMFWAIVTRTFPASNVGIAAAAVAAMMICVQLALVGAGSSVIRLYPQAADGAGQLLAAAFKIVFIASLAIAGGFIVLSAFALADLSRIGRDPLFAGAFVIACVLGAWHGLANEAAVAIARPFHIVVRALALSTAMLVLIGMWVLLSLPARSDVIFSCWAVGELTACLLLARQLGVRRPARAGRAMASAKVGTIAARGLANHALTMADRIPPMLMTVVITEILSPKLSAYWYAVWMAALTVFLVPIYSGTALFAELVREGQVRAARIRGTCIRTLGIAAVGALAIGLVADDVLGFLGPEYAAHGTRPLQILAGAVASVTILQTYFAVCRATDRLLEATTAAILAGIGAVSLGAWLSRDYALSGVAAAWLGSQSAAATWALWRLRNLTDLLPRSRAGNTVQRPPPQNDVDSGLGQGP
jgi:O-antigen/teichoic acid export membrane protein